MSKKKQFRQKYLILSFALLLFIFAISVFILLNQEQKPDPASESTIKKWAASKLHKEPNELIDEDYKSFDTFLLFGIELSDIKLIEKFTNLQKLGLADIRFPKKEIPKWMNILAKFGIFDLKKKFTIDLRPLKNLHQLKLLTIQSTLVSNLEQLKSLTNLEILNLVDIRISSLRPLMGLKNLRELSIRNCENIADQEIEDLQKALPNLRIER